MRNSLSSLRERLERVLDWLQSAGFSPHWLERFALWWKQLGLVHALAIMVAVFFPISKFVLVPHLASAMASTMAEGFDLDLEIEDWSAHIFDLEVIAHGIIVKADGPYAEKDIFKAKELAVDLSLWRRFRHGEWTREVTLVEPEVYIERLVSGHWNFQDLLPIEHVPLPIDKPPFVEPPLVDPNRRLVLARDDVLGRQSREELAFSVPRLTFKNLKVRWVENLPSQSGGGLIQSLRSTMHLDDAHLDIRDLAGPVDGRERPTRFVLEARTGDGKISINGIGNFFRWAIGRPEETSPRIPSKPENWSPAFASQIHLENVGAAAIGRMTPLVTLQPVSGSLSGDIQLEVVDGQIRCQTDLIQHDVVYRVNPDSPLGRRRSPQQRQVEYRSTGPVHAICDGDLYNPNYRFTYAFQSAVTLQGTADAPHSIREAAAWDHRRLGGQITDQSVDLLASELSLKAQQSLGGFGALLAAPATDDPSAERSTQPQRDNAVTGGVKAVGRGVKSLFQRDKKKQTKN